MDDTFAFTISMNPAKMIELQHKSIFKVSLSMYSQGYMCVAVFAQVLCVYDL